MSTIPHAADVSVLITVRNGQRHLAAAMESALRQEGVSLELVVVDDGSTDGTWDIISSITRHDPRVICLRSDPVGIARAANLGLAACRGRYIARLDADDIAMPGRLAAQTAFLDCHPACVCVGGAYREFTVDPASSFPANIALRRNHRALLCSLSCLNPICHSTVLIRSSAIRDIGGYDETFPCALDYDLWVRLARIGRIHQLPQVVALRRISHGMISVARRRSQIWNSIRARMRHFTRHPPSPMSLWFIARDLLRICAPCRIWRERRVLRTSG